MTKELGRLAFYSSAYALCLNMERDASRSVTYCPASEEIATFTLPLASAMMRNVLSS